MNVSLTKLCIYLLIFRKKNSEVISHWNLDFSQELNIDTEGKSMVSNLVSSLIHSINEELEDIETLR